MPSVAAISIAPVKALALQHPDEVTLTAAGVLGNRRFFLVDAEGRLFGGVAHGPLVQVRAEVDAEATRLALVFPDGERVEGEPEPGEELVVDFWGRPVEGRLVHGPWAAALSAYAGQDVRVARAVADDAWDVEPATLVSLASCERLAQELGAEVDHRRFRMLLTLDGCEPHEEDAWDGRRVGVGEAVLRVGGPVPRCAVTTHDPDTGRRTLDTLRGIRSYRGLRDGRKLDFGVYAQVERPGRVRVGDRVEPL